MQRLIACVLLTMATPSIAKVYNIYADGQTVALSGSSNRDLVHIVAASSKLWAITGARTALTIKLQAASPQSITVIAYDSGLEEVARTIAPTGAATFTAVFGDQTGYLRIVPTGSTYDTPVGSKFKRSIAAVPGDTAVLPAYTLNVAPAAAGQEAPTAVAAAEPAQDQPKVLRHRGGQVATPVPLRQPEQSVSAAASIPVAAPAGPVDAKRWGGLAQLVGTTWATNDEVIEVDWLTPNAAMLVKSNGLFGESEVLITPAADGKRLKYQRNETGLREMFEGVADPGGNRFWVVSDVRQRTQCRINKTMLLCDRSDVSNGKPVETQDQYAPISRAQGAALLAAQPGTFPRRPKGWFDAKFGLFADLADGRWELSHTWQGGKWAKTPGGLALEVGAGTANGGAVIHIASSILGKKSLLFREATGGDLVATVSAANHKSPEARANVVVENRADGRSSYCYTAYNEVQCERWWMSHDGNHVLITGNSFAYVLTRAPRPVHAPGKFGLLGTLNELTFQSPASNEIINYTVYGTPGQAAAGASVHYYRNGEVSLLCSTSAAAELDCTAFGKTRRGDHTTRKYKVALSAARDDEFTRGGLTFRMAPDGNLTATDSKGTQTIYRRVKWSDLRYMEQAKADDDSIRSAYSERQSRKESSDAFWRGIAAGIAEIPNTMRQHSAATSYMAPTDWSARLPASGSAQSGVPGYRSMGTISRVEAPQMSLAERYRADERERFAIREKIYATGGGGSSTERPYAKAYEQLARDNAASDERKANLKAQVEGSREQEARAFAAGLSASQAGTAPRPGVTVDKSAAPSAAKASSGGTKSGGIIVRDDHPAIAREADERRAREAETAAEQAKDRAALAAYRAQDEADKQAFEKADAERRRRAEIACYGRVRTAAERAKRGGATCM